MDQGAPSSAIKVVAVKQTPFLGLHTLTHHSRITLLFHSGVLTHCYALFFGAAPA